MPPRQFTSLRDFAKQLRRDVRSRDRRLDSAIKKTSRQTRNFVMRETVPVAFGDVRDHIEVVDGAPGNSSVVASSPHAASLETGSRPHMPPVESLIAWVKLRGMQGISGQTKVAKRDKTGRYVGGTVDDWRKAPAKWAAKQLATKVRNGSSPVDAPTRLAWAIAGAIAKRGTRPQPFMKKAVPYAQEQLGEFVKAALPDKE